MKKNVLALSIATMVGGLGFANVASADVVRLNGNPVGVHGAHTASTATTLKVAEGGVGTALVVPYFTTQNDNMTVLHVTNTDTLRGKAVKVRFRGAANSDDILDFQVFLSPGDVWTAAVTTGPDGVAQLTTADNSCTIPALTPNVAQSFITARLNPALTGDALAAQTREGYIEIFNMADIPVNNAANSLYTAIKHVKGVAPCTAAVLDALETNIYTEQGVLDAGFAAPTGSLMGDWYIMNVAQTTTFSGAATAIQALDGNGAPAASNFVYFPQNSTAALNVTNGVNTADPLFIAGKIVAANYDLPDLSTPFVTAPTPDVFVAGALTGFGSARAQAVELTKALAVSSVTNQYANDLGVSAKTDWVFSMPTRRYSVAYDYAATGAADKRVFTKLSTDFFTAANTAVSGNNICVNAEKQTFWDREENTKSQGAVFSPSTVDKTQFCGETSVLSFADAGTSVLGATVARQNVTGAFVNGWSTTTVANTVANNGLPILGASFIKLTNPSASAGTSGTYGITWPHRFTK